jgi:hypothetical protein
MTQVRVHRKDNSARFKEMERWMDKNLTGEGVGAKASEGIETSPVKNRQVITESQASEPRMSPRRTGNPDKEVHSIESEEPTEFGVVWERFVIRETQDMHGALSHTGTGITTATNDTIGIYDSNDESVSQAPHIAMEQPSPCMSDYESEGYLERRKCNSRQALAKKGIFQKANPIQLESRRVMQPRVIKKKVVIKSTPQHPVCSDGEDDNVPLVTLVANDKLNVITDAAAGYCHCP